MSDTEGRQVNVRKILSQYNLYAKKNYGQNFLVDKHVLSKIISSADVTKDDFIIEIGAGLGSLTLELCKRAKHVAAFEIDKELIPVLGDVLESSGNVDIINQDILKADLNELLIKNGAKSCKIVANLPYYITTPIIFGVFESKLPVESMTIMVQKEVGERMRAKPSSKEYGALSVGVQFYSEVYLAANVPRNCFVPRPDIDSAVMKLVVYNNPGYGLKNRDAFFTIVKAAFSKRRKTLVNCLTTFDSYENGFKPTKEQAIKIVEESGFNSDIRGETLSVQDFIKLSNIYCSVM